MKKIYLIQSRYKNNWENPEKKRNDWKNESCTATKQNAKKEIQKQYKYVRKEYEYREREFRILEYEPTGRLI